MARSTTNRWLLGGLAAMVAGGVGLLLWELRSTPASPELVQTETTPAPAARQAPPTPDRPLAAVARRRPEAPVAPELAATEPADEQPALTSHQRSLLLSGDVPQRLMKAAAQCYQGEPGKFEKMNVSYTLRIRGGRASLHDVKFLSSDMRSPRLEGCVLDALEKLTWTDDQVPDMEESMQQRFTILDLRKRAPRAARPESPDEPGDEDFLPGDLR